MRDKKNTPKKRGNKGQKREKDKEESSSNDKNDIGSNDYSWIDSLYEIQFQSTN